MMGPGMIRAVNAAACVQGLVAKAEDFIYTADEIATEKAYERGWSQDDDGQWRDEDGDECDSPLEMLYQYNLPDSLQDEITDACVEAYKEEHGDEEA